MTIDRRAILAEASGIFLAGAVTARAATVETVPVEAVPVARLPDVPSLANADPRLRCVEVQGYAEPDDGGGGLFVWRSGLPIRVDGGVRLLSRRSEDGHWRRLAYDGASVRPHWFGSFNAADDHTALIQKAIDFVIKEGSGRVELGAGRYRCLSRIVLDPLRCVLSGNGATLDFSDRGEPVPPESRPIASLDQLRQAATGSWSAARNGLAHAYVKPNDLSLPIDFESGQRYRLTCRIDMLRGDPNSPFVRFGIIQSGSEAPLAGLATSAPECIALDFQWPPGAAGGQLVLSSNSEALISDFEVRALGTPECLLVRAEEASPQNGHLWLEGIRIQGPARGERATKLHGIRFETRAATRSSRAAIRDVNVEGFDTAVVLADRAYLIQFYSTRLVSDVGVHFLHASQDAGENISFFGCTIGGDRLGIWNGGGEINLVGTSVNFARQMYAGTGLLTARGCHFETNRTTRSDQYLFDVSEGHVALDGGTLMISGHDFAAGNEAEHIVFTRSPYAKFTMANMYCYNLRTRTDVFAGGSGFFRSSNLAGIGASHIAPLPKKDDDHNLFGPGSRLPDPAIALDYRLEGGELVDRAQAKNGLLHRVASRDGEPGLLTLERRGESGSPVELWLLAPCTFNAKIGWSVELALEGEQGPADVVVGVRFVQVIGRDAHGAPVIGSAVQAPGRQTITLAAADGWRAVKSSTLQTRYGDGTDGSAPAFVTHVALGIDASALKPGDQLLIRDPYAGAY